MTVALIANRCRCRMLPFNHCAAFKSGLDGKAALPPSEPLTTSWWESKEGTWGVRAWGLGRDLSPVAKRPGKGLMGRTRCVCVELQHEASTGLTVIDLGLQRGNDGYPQGRDKAVGKFTVSEQHVVQGLMQTGARKCTLVRDPVFNIICHRHSKLSITQCRPESFGVV